VCCVESKYYASCNAWHGDLHPISGRVCGGVLEKSTVRIYSIAHK